MKSSVVYARVSTDNQDTKRQLNELVKHSKILNCNVEKIFTDKITGESKLDERKGLTELKDFIKTNNIKLILVSEITRIGRNNLDTLNIINDFKKDGVCVYSKKENIFTLNDDGSSNSSGDLLINILSAISQNELDTIRYRIKSGKYDSVINKKRFWGGKNIPLGYRLENKMLIIDDREKELVKEIYNLYLMGNGSLTISRILNERNIPTRLTTDKKKYFWIPETIRYILKNPLYKGEYHYKGEIYERKDLEIIDSKLFDKVNTNIKTHLTKQNKHKLYHNLLDDIPKICGECNTLYYANRKKIGDKVNGAYRCNSIRKYIECDNKSINIKRLDNAIYYFLRRTDDIKSRYDKYKNDNPIEKDIIKLEKDIIQLEKTIKFHKNQIDKTIELFKMDLIDKPTLLKDTIKHKNEIKRLVNEVSFKNDDIDNLKQLKIKQITLNEYFINLKNNPLSLKDLFKTLVNKVIIHPVNEMGILTGIKNDITHFIELYINGIDNPILFLISQRTNKISPISKGIYKDRTIRNKTNLKIIETIHDINYDELVNN